MKLDQLHLKRGIRPLLLFCMIIMLLISVITIGGCNSASSDTGTLAVSMGDSVTDKILEVWVTVEEVSVHESVDGENAGGDTGAWKTLEGEGIPGKYNLLSLIDGMFQGLGDITLKAGHYTQIRLILGGAEGDNYVVPKDDPTKKIPLQISSQDQTGIKLTKGFDIESGVVTELLLDWNVDKSIIEMPDGGYRLQPTIKIFDADVASTVSGVVTTDDPNSEDPAVTIPVQGALVTATNTDTAETTSTFTNEDGEYTLTLDEGTYNILVSKESYDDVEKDGIQIGSVATDLTGEDFTLALTAP